MKNVFVSRTVKILSLLLALVIVVSVLQTALLHHWDADVQRITGFRLEKEHTLDVVFLGASDFYAGFSAPYAYERYGFTSYPVTPSGCPVTYWKLFLEEALSRQCPQLIVVEVTGATYLTAGDLHHNTVLHYALDDMPFSVRKIKAVSSLCNEDNDSAWSFLFPIIKYHSLWNDPAQRAENRLNRSALLNRGYAVLRGATSKAVSFSPEDAIRDVSHDTSESALAASAEEALYDFLRFCHANDLNVLFVRFPHRLGMSDPEIYAEFQRVNCVGRIITEQGFPFLNLESMVADIGLDQNKDYYDRTHFNLAGQLKMTEYFSRYLVQECGVSPRPQPDEVQKEWNTSAEYYRLFCEYVKQQAAEGRHDLIGESAQVVAALDNLRERTASPEKEG